MDVSHHLLGRLWQYDRETIHEWKNNTYTFVFEKVKIVLLLRKKIEPKLSEEGKKSLGKERVCG